MSKMFKSRMTLKYDSKDLEREYTTIRLKTLKLINIIFSSITLVFSIMNTILFSLKDINDNTFVHSKYTTYITTCCISVIFLLSVFIRNTKVQIYISYFNFFFELYPFFCLKIYLNTFHGAEAIYQTLIYNLQLLFRLLWFLTNALDFFEGSFIGAIKLLIVYISFGPLTPLVLHYEYSIHGTIMFMQFVIIYLYVYEKKKAFYYNTKLKKQNIWYDSIIQNMDSGFIKVKSKGITFMNESLYNKLKMFKDLDQIDLDLLRQSELEAILPSKTTSSLILNTLFKNIILNDKQFNTDDQWVNCKNISKALNSGNHFGLIGTLKLNINTDSVIYYEVFSRFHLIGNEEVYGFLFKDITISKINAELKYKTLFLSKVAHEFKNPLLSIHEFVNQIRDILLPNINKIKFEELLQNIESISDYLIILIKDMDFYSHLTNERFPELNKDEVSIDDIITYCKNISEALINKSHKKINFKAEIKNSPAKFYTDEIKLKQILINLLSNAVKFTTVGSILLTISSVDNFIEFQVQDTGCGINSQQKAKLFQPYFDDIIISTNPTGIGLGLGLYIVKNLLLLLGSEILYESEEDKGSLFKFKLPLGIIESPNILPRKQSINNAIKLKDEISNCSAGTKTIDYSPFYIYNNENNKLTKTNALDYYMSKDSSLDDSFGSNKDYNYIIVVDDEEITRKSTVRFINKYFNELANLKILEASDGFECLCLYYKTKKKGIELSCIISDETMNYLNGSDCSKILQEIYKIKNVTKKIPFFLLTAYENFDIDQSGINEVFSKPLSKNHLNIIRSKLII
jgi:signal transduction histidine kinase/CheY-like chemotaxis protein